MQEEKREKIVHIAFIASIILKGLNGIIQLFLSGLVFITGTLNYLVIFLVRRELVEDPHDLIANFLVHTFDSLSINTEVFIATYLLIHGFINLALSIALLRKKLVAYPITMAFSSIMIIYQLYRFTHTHSAFLIGLSIFDALVIALTWQEYKYHQSRLTPNRPLQN